MLNGDEIRQARSRAGWSQADLAKAVGVSMRSIGNYERGETVPRNKAERLSQVLSQYLGGSGPSLAGASDGQLLAEIAKRFERTSGKEVGADGKEEASPIVKDVTPDAVIESESSSRRPPQNE